MAKVILTPRARRERLKAYFAGRDVFVSFAYGAEDAPYAEALAVALGEERPRFTVFFAPWASSPGPDFSSHVRAALNRCRLLVVVGTQNARGRVAVADEIKTFVETSRPVVVINVGGWIKNVKEDWPLITGLDLPTEQLENFTGNRPRPSAQVLGRIANAAKFMRQERRLRRFFLAVGMSTVLLVASSIALSSWRVKAAQQLVTQSKAAAEESDKHRVTAELQERLAMAGRAAAEKDTRRQSELAQREADIADALHSTSEAAAILQQESERSSEAVTLAVSAARKLDAHATQFATGDTLIRRLFSAVPRIDRRIELPRHLDLKELTPDGRFAVYAVSNTELALVDIEKSRVLRIPLPLSASLTGLRLSARGQCVAVYRKRDTNVGGPGAIHLWPSGREITSNAEPYDLTLSGDGKLLALAGRNGADIVEIYDTATGEMLSSTAWALVKRASDETYRIPPALGAVVSITFNSSYDALAVAGSSIGVWTWRDDNVFTPPPDTKSIVLSPTESEGAAMITSKSVEYWSWKQWTNPKGIVYEPPLGGLFSESTSTEPELRADVRDPSMLDIDKSGRLISVNEGGSRKQLDLYDSQRTLRTTIDAPESRITDSIRLALFLDRAKQRALPNEDLPLIALDSSGGEVLCGSGVIERWRPPEAVTETRFRSLGYAEHATLQDNLSAVAAVERDSIKVESNNSAAKHEPLDGVVTSLAFASGGGLFVGFNDGSICRYRHPLDSEDRCIARMLGSSYTHEIAVSRSGLVAVLRDAGLTLWDTTHGLKKVGVLSHPKPAIDLRFSRTGDYAATLSIDGRVRFWDVKGRRLLSSHEAKGTTALALSADGRYVAVGRGKEIAVWETAAGGTKPDVRLDIGDVVVSLSFDPTSEFIAVASQKGEVSVWPWHDRSPAVLRLPPSGTGQEVRFSADGEKIIILHPSGFTEAITWRDGPLVANICERLKTFNPTIYGAACR